MISQISSDNLYDLTNRLAQFVPDDKTDPVSQLCQSGQRLYASRHLLPGWLCAGDRYNFFTKKKEACRSYNSVARVRCKTCDTGRAITFGEFAYFWKTLTKTI